MNDAPLVIYHGNCLDGFGAAYAAYCHPLFKNAEFVAGIYGTPLPDVTNRDVYFLDFSAKRQQMLEVIAKANHVTIIDHHKSAQEDLKILDAPNLTLIFDMSKSGAVLAWEFFHPDTVIPDAASLIQDGDLWQFQYEATKPFVANMYSHEFTFEFFESVYQFAELTIDGNSQAWEYFMIEGQSINRSKNQVIKKLIEDSRVNFMQLGSYYVPSVNCDSMFANEAATLLSTNHPFAVAYHDVNNHRVYSLRSSKEGIDVSMVAQAYGGGGHFHAAAFRTKLPDNSLIVTQVNTCNY